MVRSRCIQALNPRPITPVWCLPVLTMVDYRATLTNRVIHIVISEFWKMAGRWGSRLGSQCTDCRGKSSSRRVRVKIDEWLMKLMHCQASRGVCRHRELDAYGFSFLGIFKTMILGKLTSEYSYASTLIIAKTQNFQIFSFRIFNSITLNLRL